MKEQIISFETAKLAKIKGFDLKYKNWYDQTGCLNPVKGARGEMCYDNVGYAPAQSILQKWLRDVHGILLQLDSVYIGSKSWMYQIPNNQSWINSDYYNTYEDALEAGLKEALNLIP